MPKADFLEVVEIHIPVTQALFDALVALSARVSSMLLGPTSWIRQWQNIDEELRVRLSLIQPAVVVEPVAVYCGTRIPGPFLSHDGATAMLLRFHGTRNTNAKGFTLHYEFVEPGVIRSASGQPRTVCGGNYSSVDQSGLIETPNYPEPYGNNIDCTWNLAGRTKDSQLQLHFQSFHLEGSADDCSRSVVRIYEGSHFRPSFEFCGNQTKLPPLVLSSSAAIVRYV
ncbi:unnamed protein product [Echinostoma caproni]|uniref:CUB domain-containing protein n=1 Tax=Echinostoma caproni TaxID=27848 RepID=A0A183AZ22_9TREM|nr:unnamed protein product [Echinostoma caproni]